MYLERSVNLLIVSSMYVATGTNGSPHTSDIEQVRKPIVPCAPNNPITWFVLSAISVLNTPPQHKHAPPRPQNDRPVPVASGKRGKVLLQGV